MYLFFAQVVWQVGNHDLCCRWNTILWWATLLWLTCWSRLSIFAFTCSQYRSLVCLVGDVGERKRLCNTLARFGSLMLLLKTDPSEESPRTYCSCTSTEATTTTTTSATASARATLASLTTTCTLATTNSSFGLLTCGLRLASKLD